MRWAVSIAMVCLACVTAAALAHAHRRHEATTFWLQRANACWVQNAHPLPSESL